MLQANIAVPTEEIAAFCRHHHIRWLAVLGSVLREAEVLYESAFSISASGGGLEMDREV